MSWLRPPVSDTPWSPEFVMQSLEILPLFLRDGRILWFRPEHAASLQVGVSQSEEPARLVVHALATYGLEPHLVHSTSWRREEGNLVLTYVAVLPAEPTLPEGSYLVPVPLEHVELARGDAAAAPVHIGVEQVLEHALRHLSWLAKDDPVVREELAGWTEALASYEPEPFRAM